MPFLPITALYTVFLAILLLILAYQVVQQRLKNKEGLGHTHKSLVLAGRNHANAAEYIPISVFLLGLAEMNGANGFLLHICGITLLCSRLAHAWGFKRGRGMNHSGRYWGTVGTWLVILFMCGVNLLYVWPYLF